MEYFLIVVSYLSLFLALFWFQVLIFPDKSSKRPYFPSVTIAVPVHNEAPTIAETLDSLFRLNYPSKLLEIVVVDDGSTDNTAEVVRRYNHVRLLVKQKNEGKAAALNSALALAKGHLFSCVDADSIVDPESLRLVVQSFLDPRVGASICSIKVYQPHTFLERLQWFEYIMSAFVRKLLAKINVLFITPGVLSVYRTSLLRHVGGFDVDNLTEDFEMALRLHKHFYKVAINTEAVGYTHAPSTLSSLINQRVRWFRGFIHNTLKYRTLIFNRAYGLLGNFQLPLSILSVALLLGVVSITFMRLSKRLLYASFDLAAMGLDYFRLYDFPTLRSVLSVDSFLIFPILVNVAFFVYFFRRAHHTLKEKWKYPFSFLFYMIYFGFLQAICWVTAVVKEVLHFKKKW